MKLFHGTNGGWLDNILKRGLEPRGMRPSRNNWKHVPHQSNPKCVYMTDSYAPYFAFQAARGKELSCAVVEIDTDRLDPEALWADEDCLEQVTREYKNDKCPAKGMSARTLWYRSQMFTIGSFTLNDGSVEEAWRFSLRALGTCSHKGPIPASAITRAVRFPLKPNAWMAFVWDPSITTINQMIMGDRYRALTAKLFGDEYPPFEHWVDGNGNPVESSDENALKHFDPDRIQELERITCS